MEKIIKPIAEPFFTNGRQPLEVRELTEKDFIITEKETKKEDMMQHFMDGDIYTASMGITIKVEMPPEMIRQLDAIDFFESYGKKMKFSELPENEQRAYAVYNDTKRISLEERLKTPKGGNIRQINKVERVVDEIIVEARKDMDNGEREKMIADMIESISKRIKRHVADNNQIYEREVIPPLTEREELDSILEVNQKNEGVAKLKEEHDVALAKISGEIEVYRKKIAELENEKRKVYIKTSRKAFDGDFEKLPPQLKSEIEEKYKNLEAYPEINRRGF